MRSGVLRLLLLLLLAVAAAGDVFLWPQPRSVVWGSGPAIPLADSFYFRLATDGIPELAAAADRYRTLIFQEKWVPVQVPYSSSGGGGGGGSSGHHHRNSRIETPPAVSPLPYLTIAVTDPTADLQQGVNESYSIVVPDSGGNSAVLEASTVWAALHGLETFSQLVTWQGAGGALVVEHGVHIEDAPLYPYRGLMLDVARNFYPVDDLKRTIRALSYSKLNVLHLHLTDSQSFPLDLPSEPNLALKGSFGPQFVYSTKDIQDLVAYARSYGVRIIPEIDMPGHSGSWGGAYPDIVTCRDKNWAYPDGTMYAVEPAPGQLNPLKEQTYKVVGNVVSDVAAAFPDRMFHAGGDEPQENCWMASPDIAAYVAGGGTLATLVERFVNQTQALVLDRNKTVVYWEDSLLGSVHVSTAALPPASVILETWNGGPVNTKRLTAAGYRTIVASADFLYLDCGRGDFVGNDTAVDVSVDPSPGTPSYNYGGPGGSWCAPYKSWQRIYDYDIAYNLTAAEAALVLGAEAALWSEQADGAVVDGLLWPRVAALAESLWSGNRDPASGARRSVDALYRLNDWRYRLRSRGIQAMPLQPLWCLKHPGQCNNVF